jgi:hypothetical protein
MLEVSMIIIFTIAGIEHIYGFAFNHAWRGCTVLRNLSKFRGVEIFCTAATVTAYGRR